MFNLFGNCLKGKSFESQETSKFNSFMFCRWLSGNPKTINLANTINFYYKIPDENQYNLVQEFSNINKIKFIKFPSFKIEKPDTKEIQEKYNISFEKALEYLDILETTEIK